MLSILEERRNQKILEALETQRKEFEADPSKARAFLMKLGYWNEDGSLKDGDFIGPFPAPDFDLTKEAESALERIAARESEDIDEWARTLGNDLGQFTD